jgi:crossover junction endodeoxyribonuclease RuvC
VEESEDTGMGRVFLGIDPGQTGSLAMIRVLDDGSKEIRLFDPPLFEVKSGKKIRHEYDEASMAATLHEFSVVEKETTCILEKVSAMPDQGVTSMFNFGMGFGLWRGMLAAFRIPYTLIHPLTWKKRVMRDMPKEKDAARQRAIQLYPQVADQLARKKDIGRADALLLAHYGLVSSSNLSI